MRANDIDTDGTEYVYRWRDWSSPVKVKVLEKAIVPGGAFGQDSPGWLVEVTEADRTTGQWKFGQHLKAKSRQIHGTWAAHEADLAEKDEERRQQEALSAQRSAANTLALHRLTAFYQERGMDTTNLSSGAMRFTASQLLALVQTVATKEKNR